MNDFISRIFGGPLNILHFFVIGAISFAIFSENSQLAEDLGDNIAAKIFGGILVLFVYSIFIGLITTIVSIRESLDELIKITKEK